MSLDAQDWVWEHSASKGTARLVLLAIADKATGRDCSAYAGTTLLVKRSNAARSSVVVAVDKLVESGELKVIEGKLGPRGETWYCLPKAVGHRRKGGPDSGPVRNPDRSENETPTGPDSGPQGSENETPTGPDSGPQNNNKRKPPERTHKEDRDRGPAADDQRDYRWPTFGEFWVCYPNPMQIEKTKRAWRDALDRGADPDLIVKAAKAYAYARRNEDAKYTPYSATWLNNGGYDDPMPAASSQADGPHRNPDDQSEYDQGWK
ncbi:hypothetical protein [Streptomyces sp. 351MFTsu5.1]|uniref:hypothetical protein n=1 Tax=Streptomyces sp. 351MFTsu5.1 TaxID=1172180 RepID=UPI0003A760A1|nr:hypothetical protein [Streptomyces sp. 351MFTsu5.1]